MERDIDSRMERTKNRPLPSGRLHAETALSVGISLIVVSLSVIYVVINPLTAFLGLLAAVIYVSLYTPLKTKTSLALFAGAVPGAIPPLMGWTSVTHSIEPLGVIIFAILFVWQLPHFLSISIYHAEDYNNASIKTFPAQIGFRSTQHRIVVYTFLLTLTSLFPAFYSKVETPYLWGVFLLGGAFTLYSFMGYFYPTESVNFRLWARKYFFGSLIYLPVVFILMLFFKTNIH
jgi:protoheme IX farnesyltransferase